MIPFDPVRPNVVMRGPIKVSPVARITNHFKDEVVQNRERRADRDRRKKPFNHRGQYEMRKGRDRRGVVHIDENI